MKTVSVDFETFYDSKQDYSVRTMGNWRYIYDERFDPYMISVCDGQHSWSGRPKDFNWQALNGCRLLSHNRGFDNLVYKRMVELGLAPALDIPEWHCTASMTAYLCNRRALDNACEYLLKIKVDKTVRANMDGVQFSDLSESRVKEMIEYARGDAINCWNLWDKFSSQWPEVERQLSNQTIEYCWRGIYIDRELLDRNIRNAHEMLEATDKQLPWIEEDYKPTSPKGIAEQCRRNGIPCPPVKSNDEEAFQEWEEKYSPLFPWIKAISSRRSVNRLLKTLTTIKERLRPDGTFPFGMKYFGAHTGRWAGDAGVNMQNPRKEPVLRNEHCLMETDEKRILAAIAEHKETDKWPTWVSAIVDERAVYCARPGKKLIMSDLAQIEPRVLNWLVGNTEFLKKISEGMPLYEAHARETMGWTAGNLKKEDPKIYALAKARVLGLGFQCGWEKFISLAMSKAGLDVTENDPEFITVTDPVTGEEKQVSGYGAFSKKCVADFREANPKIKALWTRLDDAFKSSVGDRFTLTLPSGRKIVYPFIRRTARLSADADGKPRKDWVFTADVGGKRVGFYGGKLTENLVQATARDVFGEHLLEIDRSGVGRVLFTCHDEAIVETDPDTPKEEIVRIMSQAPAWLPGCPLTAEAVESNHYLK